MTSTLVSFLGRAIQSNGRPGYQTTRYLFPDGTEREDQFFGRALKDYLNPDRLLLLGTSGSMWDVLVESISGNTDRLENERVELLDSASKNAVTQPQLDAIQPMISELMGLPCVLRIIPPGRDENDSIEILAEIDRQFGSGETAFFDVTHGYRTLPMIGLLAALFLQQVKRVKVDGLYYGEIDSGRGRANKMDGMLRIAEWIDSLSRFDDGGNFSVFSKVLAHDGIATESIAHLQRAAFHERTFNIVDAPNDLRNFKNGLPDELPGISRLFQAQLFNRLDWYKQPDLFRKQRALAWFYLERDDFVRASIFAFEAFISKQFDRDETKFDKRDEQRKSFEDSIKKGNEPQLREPYFELKGIRNYLAHGSISAKFDNDNKWIAKKKEKLLAIIKDPDQLKKTLRSSMQTLIGKPDAS